jgi:dihydrofolate reductase
VKLAIIAAVALNRGIGKDGKLPWHLSEDLKRFKRLTTGHTVLMGRKTYESIGKPLPHRRNVVLTSRLIPGVETHPTLDAALEALKNEEKIFVIGGGALYAMVLDNADEIYLTLILKDVEADTFFPPYRHLLASSFRLAHREEHPAFVFEDYVRV